MKDEKNETMRIKRDVAVPWGYKYLGMRDANN
jgi:hypothetical protein